MKRPIVIEVTAETLFDNGVWEQFCEEFGCNPWMIKEGLATKETAFGVELSKPGTRQSHEAELKKNDEAVQGLVDALNKIASVSVPEPAGFDVDSFGTSEDHYEHGYHVGAYHTAQRLRAALAQVEKS